jgi:hypothetical protein
MFFIDQSSFATVLNLPSLETKHPTFRPPSHGYNLIPQAQLPDGVEGRSRTTQQQQQQQQQQQAHQEWMSKCDWEDKISELKHQGFNPAGPDSELGRVLKLSLQELRSWCSSRSDGVHKDPEQLIANLERLAAAGLTSFFEQHRKRFNYEVKPPVAVAGSEVQPPWEPQNGYGFCLR